jgi:hypothetical protein
VWRRGLRTDSAIATCAPRFGFLVRARGTPLEGAALDVVETEGAALRRTGAEVDADVYDARM